VRATIIPWGSITSIAQPEALRGGQASSLAAVLPARAGIGRRLIASERLRRLAGRPEPRPDQRRKGPMT
jgi:hypothetical protein